MVCLSAASRARKEKFFLVCGCHCQFMALSPSLSLWGFGLFALKSKMRRQPGNTAVRQREGERERGKRDKESCLDPTTMQQTFHPLPSVHRALLLSLLPLLHLSLFLSLFLLRLVIIIIFSFLLALGLDSTRLDWLPFREYVCFSCPHAYSIIIRGCPAGR